MDDTFLRICCPTARHGQMRGWDGRQRANEEAQAAPSARRAPAATGHRAGGGCPSGGGLTPDRHGLGAQTPSGGLRQARRAWRAGRPRQLSDEQLAELAQLLKQGAIAAGYSTEMWTLKRIGTLIEEKFGVHLVPSSVWRLPAAVGLSVQRPTGRARERVEGDRGPRNEHSDTADAGRSAAISLRVAS